MKASELIKVLQAGIQQFGDLQVYQKHPNMVYGAVKRPVVAHRLKNDTRSLWSDSYDEKLKGEKVFKI